MEGFNSVFSMTCAVFMIPVGIATIACVGTTAIAHLFQRKSGNRNVAFQRGAANNNRAEKTSR